MFPYIGNNNPYWLIFFRGVETTNQFVIVIIIIMNMMCFCSDDYDDF